MSKTLSSDNFPPPQDKTILPSGVVQTGNAKQARKALTQLQKTKPEFNVDFALEHLYYLKSADQLGLYIDGLKKTGLSQAAGVLQW